MATQVVYSTFLIGVARLMCTLRQKALFLWLIGNRRPVTDHANPGTSSILPSLGSSFIQKTTWGQKISS